MPLILRVLSLFPKLLSLKLINNGSLSLFIVLVFIWSCIAFKTLYVSMTYSSFVSLPFPCMYKTLLLPIVLISSMLALSISIVLSPVAINNLINAWFLMSSGVSNLMLLINSFAWSSVNGFFFKVSTLFTTL